MRSWPRGPTDSGAWGVRMKARGFTLLEATLSLSIVGVIGLALVSAMTIGLRAFPRAGDRADCSERAAEAIAAVELDASEASSVTRIAASGIEFIVPDRDQDGVAETVSYTWAGTKGDPLVRTVNGVEEEIATNVRSFALDLMTGTSELEGDPVLIEQTAATLMSWDESGSGTLTLGPARIAQAIRPRLAREASTWRITGVRIRMRQSGLALSTVALGIYRDNNGQPGSEIESASVLETALASASDGFTSFSFTSGHNFGRNETVWLVLTAKVLNDAARVPIQSAGVVDSRGAMAVDTGSGWVHSSSGSLRFDVTGRVKLSQPTYVAVQRAHSAHMRLCIGESGTMVVTGGFQMPTRPVVQVGTTYTPPGSSSLEDIVIDLTVAEAAETADEGTGLLDSVGGLLGGLLGGGR